MNRSAQPAMTEELPYAPRRKRPLSLWNPLDYLVLLYWVFFFPQAIRWYVERFGSLPTNTKGLDAIRRDEVRRRLAIQSIGVVVLVLAVVWPLAAGFGMSLSWVGVMIGAAYGGAIGWLSRLRSDLAAGVAGGVAFGVAFGVAGGVGLGGAGGAVLGGAFGLGLGVALGAAQGVEGGVADDLTLGMAGSAVLGVTFGVAFGVLLGIERGVASGVAAGAMFGVTSGTATMIGICRVDMAALGLLPGWAQRSRRIAITVQRTSALPIRGLADRLHTRLRDDWMGGLRECEGLLRYTLQFAPVIQAIGRGLATIEGSLLLSRIAAWCDLGLYDWDVIRFQSVSLSARLGSRFWDGFLILKRVLIPRRRWRPHVNEGLRYDTPPRAACAGFWLLHQAKPFQARKAFAHVRDLPFGEEMYANCTALAAAVGCKAFERMADWLPPEPTGPELLRPGVAQTLERLGQVAREAHLVLHSRSIRERTGALTRAIGGLKDLQGALDDCPQPERVVVEKVIAQWLELAQGVATDVGTLEVRQPVASPYIVGAPVPADRLVGRESVFDLIRAAWAKPGQRDSLVVYGHRRMGKTSVMRNVLEHGAFGADTGLAYLNLQTVDWSQPLADLCHAIAFALWEASGAIGPEPRPDSFAASAQSPADSHSGNSPLAALRSLLARLGSTGPVRRYILVLDEYELLDEHLPPDQASAFVMLLRGLTQQYPWLVVALVGLHTLKERSASIFQAIYAWRSVRVSFLDPGGVADVLQVESDDFPLAFSPESIERVHRLTGGQPFLVQLLGDRLVERFNRRLREEIKPPPATFTEQDVDAVVAGRSVYTEGAAYFLGIWGQAGEGPGGQQAVLRALAPVPEGLDLAGLAQASRVLPVELDAAIKTLIDHDVLIGDGGRYRFTVELMRLWVAEGWMDGERSNSLVPGP